MSFKAALTAHSAGFGLADCKRIIDFAVRGFFAHYRLFQYCLVHAVDVETVRSVERLEFFRPVVWGTSGTSSVAPATSSSEEQNNPPSEEDKMPHRLPSRRRFAQAVAEREAATAKIEEERARATAAEQAKVEAEEKLKADEEEARRAAEAAIVPPNERGREPLSDDALERMVMIGTKRLDVRARRRVEMLFKAAGREMPEGFDWETGEIACAAEEGDGGEGDGGEGDGGEGD